MTAAPERFLSAAAVRDMLARASRLSTGGGELQIYVTSRWAGNVRWARNEITSAGESTNHRISITRTINGASGTASTSRIDDDSLRECIRRCETQLRYKNQNPDAPGLRGEEKYLQPQLWSDATFNLDAASRADLQQRLVAPVVAQGLVSAGYLEVAAFADGYVNSAGLFGYAPQTRAEFSVTVRNPEGTGSGWAGMCDKDWSAIDAARIVATATDKCKRSADPVAIEPGRYTVILEPQAVAAFMLAVVQSFGSRWQPEQGNGPWADRPQRLPELLQDAGFQANASIGMSKIGRKVFDERITLSADPVDPDGPFVSFYYDGTPMQSVKWVENGVLKQLGYPRSYAASQLNKPDPLNNRLALRSTGGATSVDEMIRTTERGLLISRLVNLRSIDYNSLLHSGTTADGLWLIERGQITKAVKNFRFRDSPLLAFNSIDVMSPPVRVIEDMPMIVPAMRVRDFSLTSLADAV